MPQFKNIKKWIFPLMMIAILIIVISFIITKIKKDDTSEPFTEQFSTSNISTDKVKLLLPYLKSYVYYKYPTRASVTSDNTSEQQPPSIVWEDLSGNKNDMAWSKTPVLDENGFHTKDNSLNAPSSNKMNFGEGNQFTFIMHVKALETQDLDPEATKADLADVFSSIKANIEGNIGDMTLAVPASVKEQFTQIKEHLSSENQTQDALAVAVMNADDVQSILNQLPNKGKRQYKPTALTVYGDNNKELEFRISKAIGNIEVDVAGVPTTNILKMFPKDDTYYSIVYKQISDDTGNLTAYVNNSEVINENVATIKFNDKSITINPNDDLNVGLKEVAIFNKALDPKELSYFMEKGVALRSILDNPEVIVPGLVPKEGYECKGTCTCPDMDPFDPYQPHQKVKAGTRKQCKCSATCTNVNDATDTFDPFASPDTSDTTTNGTTETTTTSETTETMNGTGTTETITTTVYCPLVTYSNGNYMVEGRNYGNNKRVAREIYRINYPSCPVPKLLDDWYNKNEPLPKNCPFVVDSQFNPCKAPACENVTWGAKTPAEAAINNQCRRRVNAYCEEHAYLDPFCACWRTENQDLPVCKEFRAKFLSANDKNCTAADFPIEQNPDFNKYIRKDKVPCWNCKL